ncbi:cytochrome o ubiquinol oxidase subunit IV [Buchnera aphidicola]|uniref:cytochrome o ubiquinol oxidase subunit IV n=1 Tax=Buchnera aphidicola TaxID=9 RepID=UPI0034639ECB
MNSILKVCFLDKVLRYILGFLFSIILTIIPFLVVMHRYFTKKNTVIILIVCACIQIIVQLKYFLHLTFSKTGYWNIVFLVFTMLIIWIIMFGSIWIMYNLNHHFIYPINELKK